MDHGDGKYYDYMTIMIIYDDQEDNDEYDNKDYYEGGDF